MRSLGGVAVIGVPRLFARRDAPEAWRTFEITTQVHDKNASAITREWLPTPLGEAPKARATDPEAYGLYLQAVQLGRVNTLEALDRSDALFRQVLERDPQYAPAWVDLARNTNNRGSQGIDQETQFVQAVELVSKIRSEPPSATGSAVGSVNVLPVTGFATNFASAPGLIMVTRPGSR